MYGQQYHVKVIPHKITNFIKNVQKLNRSILKNFLYNLQEIRQKKEYAKVIPQ